MQHHHKKLQLHPHSISLFLNTMQIVKAHAVLIASPGMGHLIPVLELAKLLTKHHSLYITVLVVASDNSNQKILQLCRDTQNDNLNVVILPDVVINTQTSVGAHIGIKMHESLPAIRSAISKMKPHPTALIVDLFGTQAMAIADEFDMLKYVFIASNAWFLALSMYAPFVGKTFLVEEHVKPNKPLQIPGCSPVRLEDTLEPFIDPVDIDAVLNMGREMNEADGILVNTWEDIEPKTVQALKDEKLLGRVVQPPVYPIGPIARSGELDVENPVLKLLDKQPSESVIYVSFGSGGTMSFEQMVEIAFGLELSKQRFMWVVRPPANNVDGSFFTVGEGSTDPVDYLPDGFLDRTDDIGLVVPIWAPQSQILQHSSIGAFLSHCGWNSTLESIVNGVPIIAWPLYAEQKMNARMLTEEIGVAIRSKELPTEKVVEREEIEMMVRRVMVDKEREVIKKKVIEMKNSAIKASSKGGCSYDYLSQFSSDCKNKVQFLKITGQCGR